MNGFAIHSKRLALAFLFPMMVGIGAGSSRADGPDKIFSENTKFHLLTPDAKLTTYAIDDPIIDGVACYYTVPSVGGLKGSLGLAEEVSDISLACRQYGAIRFKEKFAEGDIVLAERRSSFFKHMQIVRGCDKKRNVLVYMVYSDKLIDGSPKNYTSSVPVMPWGPATDTPKCAPTGRRSPHLSSCDGELPWWHPRRRPRQDRP